MRAATVPRPAPDTWPHQRVVVVVAHPDDEVIGCGAVLTTVPGVRVVQVTDGAPRRGNDGARAGFASAVGYAAGRRAESLAALALAGIPPGALTSLGIPDQEAPHHLVAIAEALAPLIAGADVVLTHAYEGGHGDHDAVAFAVQAAAHSQAVPAPPAVIAMPFYHAGPSGWVRQQFLPDADDDVATRLLSAAERRLKARMIAAHASQAETLAGFALEAERFRPALPRDFTCRPHDGDLLYERHGWNLSWPVWRTCVQEAVARLGLDRA